MGLPLSQYYDDYIAESKTANGMGEKEAESDTDMSSVSSEASDSCPDLEEIPELPGLAPSGNNSCNEDD